MIESLFYSIAGRKSHKVLDEAILDLYNSEYTPSTFKSILKLTIDVSEKGMYPSLETYKDDLTLDFVGALRYKNIAEFQTYVDKLKDFLKTEYLKDGLNRIKNKDLSSSDFQTEVQKLLDKAEADDESTLDEFSTILYSKVNQKPKSQGVKTGVGDIDRLTNGIQPGTVASICAFTGEGKSTWWTSIIYKNAKEGKKGLLMNLEMTPEHTWMLLQARFLYEKGMDISSQDLLFRRVSSEQAKEIESYDQEFMETIGNNIVILDESAVTLRMLMDARAIKTLFRKVEQKLGRLDYTVWDHVGQLELMFPDKGNSIIRNINSATKTYINSEGEKPCTGLAVQTNREGRKRASKRKGEYDMHAIADLNEVERASTYVMFMFTTDDSKLIQETSVSLAKHRMGSVLATPVVTTFNPAIITVGSIIDKIEADDEFDSFGGGDDFDNIF